MASSEWSDQKRYNPFNSLKNLAHVPYWRQIAHGTAPPPIQVSVDPCRACNLECRWCNARAVRSPRILTRAQIDDLAGGLAGWGVRTVCVAGGGEPLLHPEASWMLERFVAAGLRAGLITNGLLLDRHLAAASALAWVGVSVDAGTAGTYRQLKGADGFDRVVTNLAAMAAGSLRPTYKYLITPQNVDELPLAARIARESGCLALHARPACDPWDRPTEDSLIDLARYNAAADAAMALDGPDFGVFVVRHKVGMTLQAHNPFPQCWAVMMSCAVSPSDGGEIDVHLCCDRRGDTRTLLGSVGDVAALRNLWGGPEHWRIREQIDPRTCPRCTLRPHNEIFDKAILSDSMMLDFI